MRFLALFALVLALAGAAYAGDGSCGSCPADAAGLSGFSCDNHCPRAQQANAWRAAGAESLAVRCKVQADHAAAVAKNLSRI